MDSPHSELVSLEQLKPAPSFIDLVSFVVIECVDRKRSTQERQALDVIEVGMGEEDES